MNLMIKNIVELEFCFDNFIQPVCIKEINANVIKI